MYAFTLSPEEHKEWPYTRGECAVHDMCATLIIRIAAFYTAGVAPGQGI